MGVDHWEHWMCVSENIGYLLLEVENMWISTFGSTGREFIEVLNVSVGVLEVGF